MMTTATQDVTVHKVGRTTFEYPKDEPIIRITRTFDAPVALVWEAFTKPEHLARWWGPRRFTTEIKEFDMRPGGRWRMAHRDGDGAYEFFGEYLEVTPMRRIVQTFGFMDFPPSTETATFTDLGERTGYEVLSRFVSIEARDGMAASGMEGGANETYERLDEVLAELGR